MHMRFNPFRLCRYAVLILLVLYAIPSFAGSDEPSVPPGAAAVHTQPDQSAVEFNRQYFTGYFTDLKTILSSPARWDGNDWITAGCIAGMTAGLYTQDTKIQTWVQKNKNSTVNGIGNFTTDIGFGAYTIPLLGGFYLYGHLSDDSKPRTTVLLAAESFMLTGVLVQTLKFSAHRHRPYSGDPYNAFDGPGVSNASELMSFPSGHASSAFSIATVIASEYENSVIIPPLAYGIASITAINRVLHNAHWTSDIFLGSAIGYFTGKTVVKAHAIGKGTNLSILPLLDQEHVGMIMTWNF